MTIVADRTAATRGSGDMCEDDAAMYKGPSKQVTLTIAPGIWTASQQSAEQRQDTVGSVMRRVVLAFIAGHFNPTSVRVPAEVAPLSVGRPPAGVEVEKAERRQLRLSQQQVDQFEAEINKRVAAEADKRVQHPWSKSWVVQMGLWKYSQTDPSERPPF